VIERQYRHAANQYLWELPAGSWMRVKSLWREPSVNWPKRPLQREEMEASGDYYASPGFLGESMIVFQAEGW